MSILGEYLRQGWNMIQFQQELQKLLKEYSDKLQTTILVYAGTTDKPIPEASLLREDYYVIHDFIKDKKGKRLDFYLETPGGRGDVAEDIVRCVHDKFESVYFLIAGEAKSAGTIMALSGDEIFMSETGSLGPIDAQSRIGRSQISTSDYIEWVEKKHKEASEKGRLNPFDATVIAQVSPGELNGILHQNKFAQDLVVKWLPKYKFKNWNNTETHNTPVTEEMKQRRAEQIAKELAANSEKWRIHGKSIKIEDLAPILKIKRIEDDPVMSDLVYRIHTICRILFDMFNVYKIFATPEEAFMKQAQLNQPVIPAAGPQIPNAIIIDLKCDRCGNTQKFYHKLVDNGKVDADMASKGLKPLPSGNTLACGCGNKIDLIKVRSELSKSVKLPL